MSTEIRDHCLQCSCGRSDSCLSCLSLSLSLRHIHSCSFKHIRIYRFSLSLMHIHICPISLSFTHIHGCPLSLSVIHTQLPFLSHIQKHSHTYTFTYIDTYTHTYTHRHTLDTRSFISVVLVNDRSKSRQINPTG